MSGATGTDSDAGPAEKPADLTDHLAIWTFNLHEQYSGVGLSTA
jgi:hypothetical protein